MTKTIENHKKYMYAIVTVLLNAWGTIGNIMKHNNMNFCSLPRTKAVDLIFTKKCCLVSDLVPREHLKLVFSIFLIFLEK